MHVLTKTLVIFSSKALVWDESVARLLVEDKDAQKRKNMHAIRKHPVRICALKHVVPHKSKQNLSGWLCVCSLIDD